MCVCVRVYVYVYVCVCMCVYVCVYVCVYACMREKNTSDPYAVHCVLGHGHVKTSDYRWLPVKCDQESSIEEAASAAKIGKAPAR